MARMVVAALLAAVTVGLVAPTPAAAAERTVVRYGIGARVAPFWIMFTTDRKGFFAENGITLDVVLVPGGIARVSQAMAAGSLEMGGLTPDTAWRAAEKGGEIALIAGELNRAVYTLVVQPEVKDYADLKGKTLAVTSAREASTIVLKRMLAKHGLEDGDYDLLAMGGTTTRVSGLKAKQVAGSLLAQPQDFQLAREGFRVLDDSLATAPEWPLTAIAVNTAWAKANRDAVLRFLKAYRKGARWLYDPKNKDEAIQILADETKSSKADAAQTYAMYIERVKALSRAGELSRSGLEAFFAVLVETGELKAAPDYGTLVDESFLRELGN